MFCVVSWKETQGLLLVRGGRKMGKLLTIANEWNNQSWFLVLDYWFFSGFSNFLLEFEIEESWAEPGNWLLIAVVCCNLQMVKLSEMQWNSSRSADINRRYREKGLVVALSLLLLLFLSMFLSRLVLLLPLSLSSLLLLLLFLALLLLLLVRRHLPHGLAQSGSCLFGNDSFLIRVNINKQR